MAGRLSRREFAGLSVGSMAALILPRVDLAEAACSSAQSYLPASLTIDCASHKNFALFRKYSDYIGLAGVICMKPARGVHGSYNAGTLILYPWLKPAGQASKTVGAKLLCTFPTGASKTKVAAGKPIPNALLPQDEYICRYLIQAPWQNFIGFMVDAPTKSPSQTDWRTSVPKLADGLGVDIDWSSANLNPAWFGGGHTIPASATCNGAAWRKLIASTLNVASKSTCS